MTFTRTCIAAILALILAASITIQTVHAKPGGRDGPPQEAFDACAGMVEGDACSFSGDRGDAEGTCIVPPRGEETLICAPADGGRGLERRRGRDSDTDDA